MPVLLRHPLLIVFLGFYILVSVPAQAQSSLSQQVSAEKHKGLSEAHRRSLAKREASVSGRHSSSGLHQFVNKEGSITFTNKPTKYNRNPEYEPIKIDYQPISVPAQFRALTSPSQYSTSNIAQLIRRYAEHYNIDEDIVYAVIKAESNFNPNAVSPAGASGLMQLMPGTAAQMGVTKIFDPAENIAGGTQYLSKMLEIFDGNVSYALAGYNAGPENVKKHNGIPPFRETQAYVPRVLKYREAFRKGGENVKNRELGQLRQLKIDSKPIFASNAGGKKAVAEKPFLVLFHSGLSQPADKVDDKDPFWYIHFGDRTYPVRKDLVKEIKEAA